MRLFLISLGALICASLVLIIVRFWGLSMPTYKFEHEFYNFTQSERPLKAKVFHSEEDIKNELKKNPELIVYLNAYISLDHQFVLDTDQKLENQLFTLKDATKNNADKGTVSKFKGRYVHNYNLEELQSLRPNLPKLEEVLKNLKDDSTKTSLPQKFILNVKSNATDIHKDVIQLIEKYKLEKQILIISDYDIVLKSIKDEKPQFTFGTSLSEVMRLKTFSTIFLEPSVSMKGDALTSKLSYKSRPLITQQIVDEIKRRQRFVFLGPLESDSEISAAQELKPDVLIVE